VISTATDAVTGTISLAAGSWPEYVAFTPNGAAAYVTDDGNGTVSAIDTGTEAVTATIPVGEGPFGLAVTPNGSAVYVANTYTVSEIATATDTVTGTITSVGNPAEVAADPGGGAVYLSSTDAGGVSVIGTESNTISGILAGAPSWGVAVSPDPEVTAVTPDGGPPAGGNQVTLTGVGFNDVLNVTFGGEEATSYTVTSPTTITATVPAGRPGPVYAFVTTIRGSSSTSAGSEYTYQSVPAITGVSPDYGPAAGGRVATITGTGLSGPVTVRFGTNPAAVYSQSPTQLQVVVPAGSLGTTVNITVSTSVGTSAFTSVAEYSYVRILRNPIPLTD
jgi:YVTN family beta-propeller protein